MSVSKSFDGRIFENFCVQLGRAEVAFEDQSLRELFVFPIGLESVGLLPP
jgi:hypothetical protein